MSKESITETTPSINNDIIAHICQKIDIEKHKLSPAYISEKNKLWGLNKALDIINEEVKNNS